MTDNATPERLRELARIGYDSMGRTTRPNGDAIVVCKDDAPGWVGAIIREAHGDDLLPDDWRYECIRDAFSWIADSDTDDLDDSHDFADSTTDVYNADLLRWVGSGNSRGSYVDDAQEDFGPARDFYHGLQMGQYAERAEVYAAVLAGLRSVDTEYDEEEE